MQHSKAPTLEQLSDRNFLRERYPRKVIVLSSQKDSRSLRGAIDHAVKYENPSHDAEIVYSEGGNDGWIWSTEFQRAKNAPNTFLVLEDGSVLQRPITELHKELKMISSMGGGLSFAHQSNALFDSLGAPFCILADEPLDKLVSHLEINSYLNEMNLLLPLNQDSFTESARNAAKELIDNGTPVVEVSRRLGLNRATIHRWIKTWGTND